MFDLDETLVHEAASVAAAFLSTGEIARARYGIAPDALHRAVLQRARELWRAAPTIGYCQQLGIASWETRFEIAGTQHKRSIERNLGNSAIANAVPPPAFRQHGT